jgi:hypothetical protein
MDSRAWVRAFREIHPSVHPVVLRAFALHPVEWSLCEFSPCDVNLDGPARIVKRRNRDYELVLPLTITMSVVPAL